jgi:hypothetical protein
LNGAATKVLRPTQARGVQRILRGLGASWDAPVLANIGVVANPRGLDARWPSLLSFA